MFTTSVIRGEIWRRCGIKQKEQQGNKQVETEGNEESIGGLDMCSAQEDWNFPGQKQSKKAYQLVKDLTSEKQGSFSTIQDKFGKCLTEEQEILSRWTEYCSELYNHKSCGDNTVLDCS